MKRLVVATATAALLTLFSASPASAGFPTVLGAAPSSTPTVTAGGNGLFHVVYNDAQAFVIRYCQVQLPAVTCAKSAVIPFNDNKDGGDSGVGAPGSSWIVTDPAGGPLRLIIPQYVSGNTYEADSTDNGATWSPVRIVHNVRNHVEEGRPILEANRSTVLVPRAGLDGPYVHDTSDGASDVDALLDGGGKRASFNPSVANVANGTIATADDLDDVYFWFAGGGSPLTSAPSWGTAALAAPAIVGGESMAGGGGNAFLASSTRAGGYRLEVRKWGGMGFGKPTTVLNGDDPSPDVSVTTGGKPGIVYNVGGGELGFAAQNSKGVYETKPIVRSDQTYYHLDSAYDDSGKGLAVWTVGSPGTSIGAADITEVADPSAEPVTVTVSKNKLTLGLTVPGSCVNAGRKVTVGISGQGGRGAGTVKKVAFTFGAQKHVDDSPPRFGATFTVPKNVEKGQRIPVTSTAFVKSKAGKISSFKINNSVDVCGG